VLNAPLPQPFVIAPDGEWPATLAAVRKLAGDLWNRGRWPVLAPAPTALARHRTPSPSATATAAVITASALGTSFIFTVNNATQAATQGLALFAVMGNIAVLTTTVQRTNLGNR
jgi:hypothetical protein